MRRTTGNSLVLLIAALPVAAALLVLQWSQRPARITGLQSRPLHQAINLNTADRRTLQLLPGVGASLADAIADRRERMGGFDDIAQLENVPGVGTTTSRRIEPWVTLGAPE